MNHEELGGKTSLSMEEIAAETRLLAAESSFGKTARRFLSVLHAWAGPSAVLCLAKDASAEMGWRSVPELTLGPVAPAFEHSIIKLIEDSPPGSLSRPVPVRPRDEVPGAVKVRDNWLVPWSYGESSGYVFIRGIARSITNFGEAVTLLSQPVWPRLSGESSTRATAPGAAAPVTVTPEREQLLSLVAEATQLSERLLGGLREERERLGARDEGAPRRVAELEGQLALAVTAREEALLARSTSEAERESAREELETLKRRTETLEAAARETAETHARALAQVNERLDSSERANAAAEAARGEKATALADLEQARAEVAALTARLATLEAQGQTDAEETRREAAAKAEGELTGLRDELKETRVELEQARAEASELKGRLESAPQPEAVASVADRSAEVEGLMRRTAELEEKLESTERARAAEVEKARAEVEGQRGELEKARAELDKTRAEAEGARGEVGSLKTRLEALEAGTKAADRQTEVDGLRAQITALEERVKGAEGGRSEAGEKLGAAEAARDEARAGLEAAKAEAGELKSRIEALEKQVAESGEKLRSTEAARDEAAEKHKLEGENARSELEAARAELGKLRSDTEAERESTQRELAAAKVRIETLEKEVEADKTWEPVVSDEVASLQEQLSDLDNRLTEATRLRAQAEQTLTQRTAELEQARQDTAALTGKSETTQREQEATEAELTRAKAETSRLWQTVESLQRQLQTEAERLSALASEKSGLATTLASVQQERDNLHTQLIAANDGLHEVEARGQGALDRWSKVTDALTSAAAALRRTPFVPPTLKIAFGGVEEALAAEGAAPAGPKAGRGPRVLFLDRDLSTIEKLAGELEAAGIEVLVAHYPEEASFFLKTPEARRLTAMVCDVMAFRADQNLLELFRSWRADMPTLALLLSFKADNTMETEKAQRIPVVLTAGYLTRPLDRQAVLDAVQMVARRQGGR